MRGFDEGWTGYSYISCCFSCGSEKKTENFEQNMELYRPPHLCTCSLSTPYVPTKHATCPFFNLPSSLNSDHKDLRQQYLDLEDLWQQIRQPTSVLILSCPSLRLSWSPGPPHLTESCASWVTRSSIAIASRCSGRYISLQGRLARRRKTDTSNHG